MNDFASLDQEPKWNRRTEQFCCCRFVLMNTHKRVACYSWELYSEQCAMLFLDPSHTAKTLCLIYWNYSDYRLYLLYFAIRSSPDKWRKKIVCSICSVLSQLFRVIQFNWKKKTFKFIFHFFFFYLSLSIDRDFGITSERLLVICAAWKVNVFNETHIFALYNVWECVCFSLFQMCFHIQRCKIAFDWVRKRGKWET